MIVQVIQLQLLQQIQCLKHLNASIDGCVYVQSRIHRTHLSGSVGAESKATADDVEAEPDQAVKHAFKQEDGWKYNGVFLTCMQELWVIIQILMSLWQLEH